MTRLTIIGYHNVEGTHYFPYPAGQGTRGFEQQLQILRRTMNIVPLGEALRALSAGRKLPHRAVSITFDDGYRDSLDVAAPILERYSVPATFFLVPTFLSREGFAWWERLAWAMFGASAAGVKWNNEAIALGDSTQRTVVLEQICADVKRVNREERESTVDGLVDQLAPVGSALRSDLFLDWEQSRQLLGRGFEIGSHSNAHAILAREDGRGQREDLEESKRSLEDELDTQVDLLAYPNGERGDFTTETIDALRGSGYTHAVTTIPGRNTVATSAYELYRVVVSPSTGRRGLLEGLARTWKPRPQP